MDLTSETVQKVRAAIVNAVSILSAETGGIISLQEGNASLYDLLINFNFGGSSNEVGQQVGNIMSMSHLLKFTEDIDLLPNYGDLHDIYAAILHEMGHYFGLEHSTTTSIMNYRRNPAKRTLTTCDQTTLRNIYNPLKPLTAKNNFGDLNSGGKIKIGGREYTDVKSTGITVNFYHIDYPIELGAYKDQPWGGYRWLWRFWNIDNAKSLQIYVDTLYRNRNVTANYVRELNITLQNNFIGVSNGGIINVNGINYNLPHSPFTVADDTSITFYAPSQTINGINYTFSHWSDSSTQSSRTENPSDHTQYTANYLGRPSTANRNQRFGSTIGQPINLLWDTHINPNVTQYRVYRKVDSGAETLLGTTSSTSFTDYEYTMTGDPNDYRLAYDVRPVYSIENTESLPNYVSITYGELSRTDNSALNKTTAEELPAEYAITNYPNPFNPTTTISYQLPKAGFVTIKVYDMIGREVAILVNGNKSAGYYRVEFDASELTSGIYVYSFQTEGYSQSGKMLLVK